MKFSCDQCHAQYMIADEKVGQKGVKVKCKKCGNIIVVKPRTDGTGEAPSIGEAPAAAASSDANSEAPGIGSFSAPASSPAPAAAPAQDSQMGGAFDSLFGGGAPATASAPSAGLSALAAASAPAVKKGGEKEWYVAIDDSQVGPIDVAEIEQRWEAREIEEDSLAWKSGMSDWVPIAEIPELAYLITQKPHQKAPAARGGLKGASAGAAAGAAAFGAAAAASEEISWKPSAASALSSLVQEEIQAANAPKPEPVKSGRPTGVPDLGFGAGDLFGKAAGGNGSSAAVPDPFAAPAPAWSVPTTPRRSGGFRAIYLVFGFIGIAIVGLLGFVAWRLTSAPVVAPVAQAPAAGAAVSPSAPQASATAPAAPAQQQTAAPQTSKPQGGGAKVAKDEPKRDEPKRDDTPSKTKGKSGGGGGDEEDDDDLFPDKKKVPAKDALTRADIMSGVKENGPKVAECIKAARGKNEIVPGAYTFILDWTIKTDGSVKDAKLKGPANVMGGSLPACFASAIRNKWTFPASSRETPIANFPFGPINIR